MKKILLICLFALTGCATNNVSFTNTNQKIKAESSVYIAKPTDGKYESKEYDGSGAILQSKLVNHFSEVSNDVMYANSVKTNDQNIKDAKANNASVLVVPQITLWEDRNTPWSGKRDKVKLILTSYDVSKNKTMNRAVLYGTNRWFTFVNNRPSVLLDAMISKYLQQVIDR